MKRKVKRFKKQKKIVKPYFICTCGHTEEDHKTNGPWNGWCGHKDLVLDDGDLGGSCLCIEFRADTLLYLEELNRLNGTPHYNEGRHGY